MRLTELEPQFVQHVEDARGRLERHVDTLADAHGILFLCPVCFTANAGPVGTHAVLVTFAGRGVPDHLGSHNDKGKPSRWSVEGTGLSDLTTRPSIHLKGAPCNWHGYITAGDVS